MHNGDNIVLPKVGSDFESLMKKFISPAKKSGYKIYVHYVELNRNKALGRMLSRFAETGRFLEPGLIDEYAPNGRNRIDETYERLKKEGGLDGYSKWNNDVRRNEDPKLIENGGKSAVDFYGLRDGRDGEKVGISDGYSVRFRGASPGDRGDGFMGTVPIDGRSEGQGGIGYGMGEPGGSILEGSSGLLEGQRGRTYADGGAGAIQESRGMAENTSQQKEDERREISVQKLIEQAEGLGLLSDEELCCVKEILEKHEGFPIDGSIIIGIYREKDEDLFLYLNHDFMSYGIRSTADELCNEILKIKDLCHNKVSYNYVDSINRILNSENGRVHSPAYDTYISCCLGGSAGPDCFSSVMYSCGRVKTLTQESNPQNSIKRTR
jgi:hypothetical protein